MDRWKLLPAVLFLVALAAFGCTGSGNSPLTPDNPDGVTTPIPSRENSSSGTHLWGIFECRLDIEQQTIDAVPSRGVMFTANVVHFLNSNPSGLTFQIIGTPMTSEYVDVDLNVGITHPFPGLPQYHGYDVRGVFMGDGSDWFKSNSSLIYPVQGTDQIMMANPDTGDGGPDGYTRWFNQSEFPAWDGMPLFSYTPGAYASPGFEGSATICPYRYFADALDQTDNLWDYLMANPDQNGRFSSGATNRRNYYIRFPNTKGVTFGYAILANWLGEEPEYHPSNAPEAVACRVEDNSEVYYLGNGETHGSIELEISLFGWEFQPDKIIIESTVLTSGHEFDAPTITTGGDEHVSTYHVEIDAEDASGTDGHEYWAIAEYTDFGYANDFGTTNLCGNDPLSAFFRYDLDVQQGFSNEDPICDLLVVTEMPASGWNEVPVEFDASGSYDPDGDEIEFEWDFNGNGIYSEDPEDSIDEGDSINPVHYYTENFYGIVSVLVTDTTFGEAVCQTDPLDITVLTSCPVTATPSGTPSQHYVPYSNSPRAGLTDGITDAGDSYWIGHLRNYSSRQYGWFAIDENGSVVHSYLSPVQPNYPPTLQGMVGTAENRIYVITYEQYIYDESTLYYVYFDPSTGFSGLLLMAPMPPIDPWYYVKITADEDDNPVALVGQGTELAIKHWNGTTWDHIDIDDEATMYTECGYWNNGIEDIAYHPVTGEYWITNRYHGYTPNYEGVPTLYVIDSDGETVFKDDAIYPSVPDDTQYSVGVHIDVKDPDCRAIVLICCGSTGVNEFPALFIRYDPFFNTTGSGYMSSGSTRYEFGNGSVITSNGTSYYAAPVDFGGVWTGVTTVPDW